MNRINRVVVSRLAPCIVCLVTLGGGWLVGDVGLTTEGCGVVGVMGVGCGGAGLSGEGCDGGGLLIFLLLIGLLDMVGFMIGLGGTYAVEELEGGGLTAIGSSEGFTQFR